MAFLLSSFLQIPPIALGFDIGQPDHLPWQLQHTWQEVRDRRKTLVPGIVLSASRSSICFGWVSFAVIPVTPFCAPIAQIPAGIAAYVAIEWQNKYFLHQLAIRG
jgi:hypothetical protein